MPFLATSPGDADLRSAALLYRNSRVFAIGHGCAATWGRNDPGPAGPPTNDFSTLHGGATNIVDFIGNANNGTFNGNGILAANSAVDPGFHGYASWGNTVGGVLGTTNEILFGDSSQLIGWRADQDFNIIRSALLSVSTNAASGDISFAAAEVPLPGAAPVAAKRPKAASAWARVRFANVAVRVTSFPSPPM